MPLSAQMIGEPEWQAALADEFDKPSLRGLSLFLDQEIASGKVIFPPRSDLFRALTLLPLSKVKLVILGQDPYHGEGQAHGLSFSVQPGVKVPPSLRNIYKELQSDLGCPRPDHGCLEPWVRQGVLLLNAVLTVESGKANAHQNRGWEAFTDRVIQCVAASPQPSVFILWGAYAQKKAVMVDEARHLVLRSAHPSPLSARHGFFGSQPFSKANQFLSSHGREPIDWSLPSQTPTQASLF